MKKTLHYTVMALSAILLLAFSGNPIHKNPVMREWMSDAYLQIHPTYYTYDESGRVIRSEQQNPDTFITTYTYSASSILSVTYNSATHMYDSITYTLGSNGLVTADNRGNKFGYDNDGKQIMGVDGEAYSWANGDMMLRTYYDGSKVHTVHYTYTDILDTRDYGDAPWGFRSAHLVQTVSDPPATVSHKYIIDSQGRVQTDSAGATVYHYFYKFDPH